MMNKYSMKRYMDYHEMMKEREDEFLKMNLIEFFEHIKDHLMKTSGNDGGYDVMSSFDFIVETIYGDKKKYEKVKKENNMIMKEYIKEEKNNV
jgi:hypothetical protein